MSHEDLRALFPSCMPKKSVDHSHTQVLVDLNSRIMQKQGVRGEHLRPIDHEIALVVWPDMTEHGWSHDACWRSCRGRTWRGLAGPGLGQPVLMQTQADPANDLTKKNTILMEWNLIHITRPLKNQTSWPTGTNNQQPAASSQQPAASSQQPESGAPLTGTEITLAQIWCGLLHPSSIGRNDDFFAHGSQFLQAHRVDARIRSRFGVAVSLSSIFDHPAIPELIHQFNQSRGHQQCEGQNPT